MRTVNSQLSRFINTMYERDSQAIRERFKSPLISTQKYLANCIRYVWFNKQKTNKQSRPDQDVFCSASWRVNPKTKHRLALSDKEKILLDCILDPYESFGIHLKPKKIICFVKKILDSSKESIQATFSNASMYTNCHTISDKNTVRLRATLLSALKRERVPWTPIPIY